ncbi:hypothetical protein FHG87_004753 [Trinorchestia longiramus]|nr:hypothetical protein FHG87_004753 [Trinorchestia longiramus]
MRPVSQSILYKIKPVQKCRLSLHNLDENKVNSFEAYNSIKRSRSRARERGCVRERDRERERERERERGREKEEK